MRKSKVSVPSQRKGGCLRYGVTAFFVLGIIVYISMAVTAQTAEERDLRPALLATSALFAFFIWLMWRPWKRNKVSSIISADKVSKESEAPSISDRTAASYISNGQSIVRADGEDLTNEDIGYLRETDFERAQQYYENSPNPKFHRSFEEEKAQSKFHSANAEYIDQLEQYIWMPHLYSFDSIDDAIAHDQQALIAAQKLAEYCSKTSAGRQYFEDSWMHCHNSQNPDFNFIDRIKGRYSDLTLNYDERKRTFDLHKKRQAFLQHADDAVLQVIEENPGVLQRELHKHFDPDLKPTIGTAVSHLLKADKIRREKRGNSYSLYKKEKGLPFHVE